MAKDAEVKMYLDRVEVRIEDATEQSLHAVALQIEGATKVQIVQNDQVDTGFMLNSVYVETRVGSTKSQTWADGAYVDKGGDLKAVAKAPTPELPEKTAMVIVGALYAIYQEMLYPFLRPAAQLVAGQVKGIAEPIYRKVMHD